MDRTNTKILPLLTLVNDKTHQCFNILTKKTNLVGRSGFKSDLEISGDTSISRSHAEIFYEKKMVNGKANLSLKLVDKESKFGTFINDGITSGKRIDSNRPIILSLGDKIRFGVMDSLWTVAEYRIVACPSTLKTAEKEILKKSVALLDGQVTREWSDQNTHLCMKSISITEKVLICLASAKPIVTINYFIDLYKALLPNSSLDLPLCTDYIPNLIDNLINQSSVSMNINNKRKTILSGKTFICFSMEQFNSISKIINSAGGKSTIYSQISISDDEILHSKEYILIYDYPSNVADSYRYQQLLENLKSMSKRPITESEIGLAVIYSNTDKHCNPYFDMNLINLETQSSEIKSQASVILAPETEALTTIDESEVFSKNVVPETEALNTIEESEIHSTNVIPDSDSQIRSYFKRPLKEVMDSEEIMPKKRALFSKKEKNTNNSMKIRLKENAESLIFERENIPSTSTSCFKRQFRECNDVSKVNGTSTNVDSYSTIISNTQGLTNKTDTFQNSTFLNADKNVNNTNNDLKSEIVENRIINKRKMSNDNDGLFELMKSDDSENCVLKKPKIKPPKPSFFSMLEPSFSNKSKLPNSVEPKINNAIDPDVIMDLLSTAKGTGEFIDASNLPNKSNASLYEDNYLLNSVIVKTVNLVVSKPSTQTQNSVQENNSYLKNFKKFKRKAPAMKIPHIVPMTLI